jgi:hypothetical protein
MFTPQVAYDDLNPAGCITKLLTLSQIYQYIIPVLIT